MADQPTKPSANATGAAEGQALAGLSTGDAPPNSQEAYATYGISGLTRWGGVSRVYEEFLRELQGPQGMKSYREMLDNCPIVGAVMFAAQHLTRGCDFRIEPADDSSEAHRVAEFVKTALFEDMDTTWEDTLSEILTMLPYGWSLLEMTFKKRAGQKPGELSPPDEGQERGPTGTGPVQGPAKSRFNDGLIGFRSWSLRSQETLFMWEFDDQSNPLVMQQMAPPDYRVRRIPLTKALLFRTQVSKNNPEGRSILRNAWTSYYFRKNIQIIEGVGIERDLSGYPVIQIAKPDPANHLAGPDIWANDPNSIALLAQLQKIVRSVRRDEQEGMVLPWWAEFSLVSTGGRRAIDTNGIIERYDMRIAASMMADFIMLGHNAVGSKALASTKTALFSAALDSFLDIIVGIVNRQAISLLLDMNGIKQELAPKLAHSQVEAIDIADLGDYLSKLSGAGMPLFPNKDLEAALMEHANLPVPEQQDSDEDVISGKQPEPKAQPAQPPKPGQPPQVTQKVAVHKRIVYDDSGRITEIVREVGKGGPGSGPKPGDPHPHAGSPHSNGDKVKVGNGHANTRLHGKEGKIHSTTTSAQGLPTHYVTFPDRGGEFVHAEDLKKV